jgi:hypothetical protein
MPDLFVLTTLLSTTCFNFNTYYTVSFFLRLAIGFYMLIFQPPVNFCSDKNIQTTFGTKLEDFLNHRIDYNSISQTVEKVVKKIFLGRRIIVRRAAARVAPLSAQPAPDDLHFWTLSAR